MRNTKFDECIKFLNENNVDYIKYGSSFLIKLDGIRSKMHFIFANDKWIITTPENFRILPFEFYLSKKSQQHHAKFVIKVKSTIHVLNVISNT